MTAVAAIQYSRKPTHTQSQSGTTLHAAGGLAEVFYKGGARDGVSICQLTWLQSHIPYLQQ